MAWPLLLPRPDALWVRYLLSRELCRMKRPDLLDLPRAAGFRNARKALTDRHPGTSGDDDGSGLLRSGSQLWLGS